MLELQAEDLRESILERKREAERAAKRDQLLDKQIAEAEQRSLTYERQQAERIDIKPSELRTRVPGSDPPASHDVHAAELDNQSSRPIRDAACRIQPEPGDDPEAADTVGVLNSLARGSARFLNLASGMQIPLIRAGETGAFIFAVAKADHPKARITARFTDDAGLHWQVDPDLHLEKLDNRDGW